MSYIATFFFPGCVTTTCHHCLQPDRGSCYHGWNATATTACTATTVHWR